jgi:hypothetical protein
MTNKLLTHFGCSTAMGRFMQISYSLLLVELGMSFQAASRLREAQPPSHAYVDENVVGKGVQVWDDGDNFRRTMGLPKRRG